MLDGVTRLGRLFIKLCSAGSIIFRKWKATFYCDPQVPVVADIDFGLSERMLHAPRGMQVTKQIAELCQFMESCLNEFRGDISKKRREFYHMNHFTTEQLVILRSGLAGVCKGEHAGPELCSLLHAVKPGCTHQVC